MKYITLLLFVSFLHTSSKAQVTKNTLPPPAFPSIREADLRHDLYILAGDSMRGKRAGTKDELNAAAWVAEEARKAGLQPAGDNGTYFQFFNLRRAHVSERSNIAVNKKPLVLWKDVLVSTPLEAHIDEASGSVVWLKALADTARASLGGKVIAMSLIPASPLPAPGMSLWGFRYTLTAIRNQVNALRNQGASAIVLVGDSTVESSIGFITHAMESGTYQLEGAPVTIPAINIPVLLVRPHAAGGFQQDSASIHLNLFADYFSYPSENVVAVVPGADARLKSEYVLFSGHHDHDGVGMAVNGDSIYNGADDNASVSVAMLAIAKAWKKNPGKRSALFVWHGAEERGLLGSRWYAEHPTVKKESIVAVLNGDMIGRNAPDSAALLGAIAPHRNSVELVNAAMKANEQYTQFKIDTTWDNADHPERWYFRSDHLPYAQAGIPAIFFTTLLHPDYHTPRDEPSRINYSKLVKMTKWVYATGWAISNNSKRPAVDAALRK